MRDISSLSTPPTGRRAVRTEVRRFDEDLVRRGILREIDRGGQVYFVHNRVRTIQRVADELKRIAPEARYAVVHGQMPERMLESRMLQFLNGHVDVLVTTTIIESGLDIQRANTMFIDRAEMFGLADLHQLRGRVGRYHDQAWCYLLLRPDRVVRMDAERRLRAIEEFSQLGAGFQISMRDLEIRGAGNILGTEQSGHIAAVGYEMYCELLDQAVHRIQGLEAAGRTEAFVELPLEAYLPPDYVPDDGLRIDLYRRLGRSRTEDAIGAIVAELADRFGELPDPARTLVRLSAIRAAASRVGVRSVTGAERRVILRVERPNDVRAALSGVRKFLREVEPGIVHLVPPVGEDLLRFLERAFGIREIPALLEGRDDLPSGESPSASSSGRIQHGSPR
jgi:transcription-repair coupling factor (superfamily II helicase)